MFFVDTKNPTKFIRGSVSTASHDEHSGMGFTVMEQYSNAIDIKTKVGSGTKVRLTFKI